MSKHFIAFFLVLTTGITLQAQKTWNLQQCIDYAMQNNISVQQSRLNIDRTETFHDQNRYNLLPNLNAAATHGYNWGQRIDPFTNQFASERVQTNNFFLSSSLDIFNGFNKINNVRQSEQDLMASQYDLERIKNDVSLQICLAYLQVLLSKENVIVSQNQVAISQEQVDRMDRLVEAGQEPRGSLYDIQSQLAQEELSQVNNENAVTLALLNLTQLLQLSREEAANFDVVDPDLEGVGMELVSQSAYDIYMRASQSMPEVKAAEHRRSSAEYGLTATRALYQPSLSVSGSIGTGYSGANREQIGSGTNLGTIPIGNVNIDGQVYPVTSIQQQIFFGEDDFRTKSFNDQLNDNFNQNVQLNLQIPIFNGAATRANVSRARISQIEADLNYTQITNQLRFDIEQAYTDAKTAMNSYLANEKAVRALAESFKYAEVRYEQRVINALDFNNIKTQYTNAQSAMLRARYDFVFRTKILDFYLGNPITL